MRVFFLLGLQALHMQFFQSFITRPLSFLPPFNLTSQNIRFVGELVKFRAFPAGRAFWMLDCCLSDFVHHNVELACTLFESCGRFLFKQPATHAKLDNMVRGRGNM